MKFFYVIEENIKDSKIFELETFVGNDKYIKFNQNSLNKFLEKRSYKKLLNNGLFMSKKERKYDALLSIQRLVGCLYSDITGMEMHHIDKNKLDNRFINLVPIESNENRYIDSLTRNEMIEYGRKKHKEWEKVINKKERNTLSNNPLLIIDVLNNSINKTAVEVLKLFKNKIKSIKVIRKIINTYFYMEDFLEYLKYNKINIFGD